MACLFSIIFLIPPVFFCVKTFKWLKALKFNLPQKHDLFLLSWNK